MKNPFWKIKSILILLFIPFSFFLFLISIFLVLFTETNEYTLSFILISIGIVLSWFSIRYVIKTDKKFKNDRVKKLNENSKTVVYFKYSEEEWNLFAKKSYEEKLKKYRIIALIITPFIVAFFIMLYFEDVKLLVVIAFMLLSIATMVFLMLNKTLEEFKKHTFNQKKPEAKITSSGILLNKSLVISYHNQDGMLQLCSSEVFSGMNCLNFLISHVSGKGRKFQNFKLLIPKNREGETEDILTRINEDCVL